MISYFLQWMFQTVALSHRSKEICDLGFWQTNTVDGCIDSHLWRLGLLVNWHLDIRRRGGWEAIGSGNWYKHPFTNSSWLDTTSCVQIHEGKELQESELICFPCFWQVMKNIQHLIKNHNYIFLNTLLRFCCRWVCMYIYNFSFQITVIGRYGSTNARAKIPLGFYYGHTYILPWESELKLMHDPLRGEGESANQPEIDQHLAMMVALQEDIQCRLVENCSTF